MDRILRVQANEKSEIADAYLCHEDDASVEA